MMGRISMITVVVAVAAVGVFVATGCDRSDGDGDDGEAQHAGIAPQEQAEHGHGGHGGHAEHGHGDHGHESHVAPGSDSGNDPVLAAYLNIQKALSHDSVAGVPAAAKALGAAASAHQAHGGEHAAIAASLIEATAPFQGADLAASRAAFKTLSQRMIRYRTIAHAVLASTVVVHCGMADADWLQTTEAVANPYYGASMLTCGEVTKRRGVR